VTTTGGTMTINRTVRAAAILLAGFAPIALLAVATRASAATVPPRCRTHDVTLSLRHPVSSGGNEGLTIAVRNTGRAACTVRGYPRLGLTLHGQRVKSRTGDGSTYFHADPGPSVVTIAPGGTARAFLGFGTVSGTGNVRASAVTVAWRGASWRKTAPLPAAPVTVTGGKLTVTAWAATGKG
jgi:Protein of unknown function (DUF4232)